MGEISHGKEKVKGVHKNEGKFLKDLNHGEGKISILNGRPDGRSKLDGEFSFGEMKGEGLAFFSDGRQEKVYASDGKIWQINLGTFSSSSSRASDLSRISLRNSKERGNLLFGKHKK